MRAQPVPSPRSLAPTPPPSRPRARQRPQIFGASAAEDTLTWALHQARLALAGAPRCPCCVDLRAHLRLRLGSTLFLDDDPTQLAFALSPAERAIFTPRLLAAFVLIHGRRRVSIYPTVPESDELPAVRLLNQGPACQGVRSTAPAPPIG